MFEVRPAAIEDVAEDLQEYLEPTSEFARQIAALKTLEIGEAPFVQLSRHDIEADQVDEVLGYADIFRSDRPIGLPLEFEPLRYGVGGEVVIFPVDGLRSHLARIEPDVFNAVEAQGVDGYVAARGDALTGREYFVVGLLECISYCRRCTAALVVIW